MLCSGIRSWKLFTKLSGSGEWHRLAKGFVCHLFLASIKSVAAASMNQFECQLIDGEIIIKEAGGR